MHYYLFLKGETLGPFTAAEIQEKADAGEVKAADLFAEEGGTDWKPLGQMTGVRFPVASGPPALPVTRDPFAVASAFPGAGATLDPQTAALVAQIRAGGRYVAWSYAFSLVVVSFRRSSGVRFIPPGESGAGSAFGYSLISCLVGWWGFPWGIIYTIASIGRNAGGGVDVTEPVLAQLVGPAMADQIVRQRPPRSGGGITALAALAPILVIVGLLALFVMSASGSRPSRRSRNYGRDDRAPETPVRTIQGWAVNNSRPT